MGNIYDGLFVQIGLVVMFLSLWGADTYMAFIVLFLAKTDSEISFRRVREHFVAFIEIGKYLHV